MLERLLILALVATAIISAWAFLRERQRRRLHSLVATRPFAGLVPFGRAAVVALTLPTCVECRTRQTPAIERLRTRLGASIHIVTLSAETHADLVTQLGVLTVPSTVVLDPAGTVCFLNQGFADETRLAQQVAAL